MPLSQSLFQDTPLNKPSQVSFEFFPAKNETMHQQLTDSALKLAAISPDFMTVTYGAGGSTRDKTAQTAQTIQDSTNIPVAAHITAVNATKELIHEVLDDFTARGIKKVIALRGDMPGFEGDYVPTQGGYAYATDLVAGIKDRGTFDSISVAGYPEAHPQATSLDTDLGYLKQKVEAGADQIITQYCFDTYQVLDYIEKVNQHNINAPVVVGIMLMANFNQMVSFSGRCGATIPHWLTNLCDGIDNHPQQRTAIATAIALEQCRVLMDHGIDKFHFYSLNRHEVALNVATMLGMKISP